MNLLFRQFNCKIDDSSCRHDDIDNDDDDDDNNDDDDDDDNNDFLYTCQEPVVSYSYAHM